MPTESLPERRLPWNRIIVQGSDFDEEFERLRRYSLGGYHPVHLEDLLDNGRYCVIHKLGHGGFSTVWLCQDNNVETPEYVAIKIITAHGSGNSCNELRITSQLRESQIIKRPGGNYICLPTRHFYLKGPNGTHACLVYPVLGPHLGCVLDIWERDRDQEEDVDEDQDRSKEQNEDQNKDRRPNDYARQVRQLSKQVVQGLAALHDLGFCHGDIRPRNILLQLRKLDGLDKESVYDILGEPETAEVRLPKDMESFNSLYGIPQYLVYPVDFGDINSTYLGNQIYITDFGESFDTSVQHTKSTGIPRPYCAPEQVFEKAVGAAGDLWSLGCLIFEVRLRTRIIDPCDIMGPDDEEYAICICEVLGRLPEPWWSLWNGLDTYFRPSKSEVHGRLIALKDVEEDTSVTIQDGCTPIMTKIEAACFEQLVGRPLERFQHISMEETCLLANLLEILLRYRPEQRLSAREASEHEWFAL